MLVEILAGFGIGLWVGIAYCARERLFDLKDKCKSFRGRDFEMRLNGFESRIVRAENEIREIENTIAHNEAKMGVIAAEVERIVADQEGNE